MMKKSLASPLGAIRPSMKNDGLSVTGFLKRLALLADYCATAILILAVVGGAIVTDHLDSYFFSATLCTLMYLGFVGARWLIVGTLPFNYRPFSDKGEPNEL